MNPKYAPLFEDLTLNCGVVLHNRFALAPMLVAGTSTDGTIDEEEVAYYRARNNTGQLLIAGASAVSKYGKAAANENHICEEKDIEQLKKLADALKERGNKAIIQLHHAGREAVGAYELYGKAFAPSRMEFPWLTFIPEELTSEQVLETIEEFGNAAALAIKAGFDGVEIHGASHYLIKQFFSVYSNHRTDEWGGSLEKRMAYPLAVLKKVKEAVKQSGKKDFIVGYRICPDEVHGETIGYSMDDLLRLVDAIAVEGLDYIHSSTFSSVLEPGPAYKRLPKLAANMTIPANSQIRDVIAGRCAFITCGQIQKADHFLDALNYGDICAVGVLALADPDYVEKIQSGKEDEIAQDVTGRLDKLSWTSGLKKQYATVNSDGLPPVKGVSKNYVEY